MRQAYEDEDNAPMFGDVPLPYSIRTWAEMIEAWEGKYNADGQGQVSGGLESDCLSRKGKGRMDLPGLRDAVPETWGTV